MNLIRQIFASITTLRLIIRVCTIVFAVLILSACGGGNNSDSGGGANPSPQTMDPMPGGGSGSGGGANPPPQTMEPNPSPTIMPDELFLPTDAQEGWTVVVLRVRPAPTGTANWEILSGNAAGIFRLDNDGRLTIARSTTEPANQLLDSYTLNVRVRYDDSEVSTEITINKALSLSGSETRTFTFFSIPPNRFASFTARQIGCSAANGICCAMDVDASEDYLDFDNLVPTSADPDLIRLLLPPVPTESPVELTMKSVDGQSCSVMAPNGLLSFEGEIARYAIIIDGLVGSRGLQNDVGITRFSNRVFLLDISRRFNRLNGLANRASILTVQYIRNDANNDNSFIAFNYEPENRSDIIMRSAVDAHKYSQVVFDYLKNVLDLNSYDGRGSTMLAVTNVDFPTMTTTMDVCGVPEVSTVGSQFNAVWVSERKLIAFTSLVKSGRDEGAIHPYSAALDAVAHEWAHGVDGAAVDLVYERESGALSEAYADWFGIAVERSVDPAPDWTVGEDALRGGRALRSLQTPGEYGDPDTYQGSRWNTDSDDLDVTCDTYCNDSCGVHTNSGVGNKMFYLLAMGDTHNGVTVNGIGTERAIQIATHALRNYWTPNTNYAQARATMVMSAMDLFGFGASEQTAVEQAWQAVDVN